LRALRFAHQKRQQELVHMCRVASRLLPSKNSEPLDFLGLRIFGSQKENQKCFNIQTESRIPQFSCRAAAAACLA